MSLVNCPECGWEISDKAKACSHCGYPLNSHKNTATTSKRIVLSLLALVALGIIVFLVLSKSIDNSDYFRNTRWGMSKEEVKKSEINSVSLPQENDDMLNFMTYDNFAVPDIECQVSYEFENDSLVSAILFVSSADLDQKKALEILDAYQDKFGEYEKLPYALGGVWKTAHSFIQVFYVSEGIAAITYKDITRPDLYET